MHSGLCVLHAVGINDILPVNISSTTEPVGPKTASEIDRAIEEPIMAKTSGGILVSTDNAVQTTAIVEKPCGKAVLWAHL